MNALNKNPDNELSNINAPCNEENCLVTILIIVLLDWDKKEANLVAHALAKFVAHQNFSFCCNNSSLPPVKEAWLRDVLPFYFNEIFPFSKKKIYIYIFKGKKYLVIEENYTNHSNYA